MKTVLNPHLVNKAVDIYATTPNVQHNFVADELGISYKTLLKLRKDADFWKKVWDTYLVTYEADVLDVCVRKQFPPFHPNKLDRLSSPQ